MMIVLISHTRFIIARSFRFCKSFLLLFNLFLFNFLSIYPQNILSHLLILWITLWRPHDYVSYYPHNLFISYRVSYYILIATVLISLSTRQCNTQNFYNSIGTQNLSTLIQSCTRCKYIIYQNNPLPCHITSSPQCKRTL